jgi:predicted metal-binding membrane protein
MGEMPMTWMRMPGQSWPGAAASFLGAWVVMMAAMMLPALVPMLRRYRQAVSRGGEVCAAGLVARVGIGYFIVWMGLGVAMFSLGAALAAVARQLPALTRTAPIVVGVVVLIAGALQFTAWKAHHLACCREMPGRGRTLPADAGTAWRHGVRLGLHCTCSCAGATAILLATKLMDPRLMAVVAGAVTLERIAPRGERVAGAIGAVVVGAGVVLIARAALPG